MTGPALSVQHFAKRAYHGGRCSSILDTNPRSVGGGGGVGGGGQNFLPSSGYF